MFAVLHDIDNKEILVDLMRAETIQDKFITFNNYGLAVKEPYDEIKNKLYKMIENQLSNKE